MKLLIIVIQVALYSSPQYIIQILKTNQNQTEKTEIEFGPEFIDT